MGNLANRVFAALPDAVTSAIFLTAWIAPGVLGPVWVKNLMLTMLIEFIVMHSGAFYSRTSRPSSGIARAALAGADRLDAVLRRIHRRVFVRVQQHLAAVRIRMAVRQPLRRHCGCDENAAKRELMSRAWIASVMSLSARCFRDDLHSAAAVRIDARIRRIDAAIRQRTVDRKAADRDRVRRVLFRRAGALQVLSDRQNRAGFGARRARQRDSRRACVSATASRSANTPAAVSAMPAPGPAMVSGAARYSSLCSTIAFSHGASRASG